MRHSPVLESALLAGLFFAGLEFGPEALRPFVDAGFVGGLLFLYGLGRGRSELRWTWGPPVLRVTCWMAYACLLCRWDAPIFEPSDERFLRAAGLLILALFGTTQWGFTRCLGASRGHVTDGKGDAQRDHSLSTMLRVIGLARGAGWVLTIWYVVTLVLLYLHLPVVGQGRAILALLCALGVAEAVTALVFGERVCACCDTAPADSSIMFARTVGLLMVTGGWTGLLPTPGMIVETGAVLFALSVLSSGSPATLPVMFRPTPERSSPEMAVIQQVYRSRRLEERVVELTDQLSGVKRKLAQQERERHVVLDPDFSPLDVISLRVAVDMVPLVQADSPLWTRIGNVRQHLGRELGLALGGVRVQDDPRLQPGAYAIRVHELEVASGQVEVSKLLAIGPAEKLKRLDGTRVTDPTYGMPGVWIYPTQREYAEKQGCMIFDDTSVVITQLTEVVRSHAPKLLGIAETVKMLEHLADSALVSEVVPKHITLIQLRDLLRGLLAERVSVRPLGLILEAIAGAPQGLSVEQMIELARAALAPFICAEYQNNAKTINAITLSPRFEALLLEGHSTEEILQAVAVAVVELEEKGLQPIIVCSPSTRPVLRRLVATCHPSHVLLSQSEIVPGVKLNSVALLDLD